MNDGGDDDGSDDAEFISDLDVISASLKQLTDVQSMLDDKGFSMAALRLEEALACLRLEQVKLRTIKKQG
jgi:hypothetical protein